MEIPYSLLNVNARKNRSGTSIIHPRDIHIYMILYLISTTGLPSNGIPDVLELLCRAVPGYNSVLFPSVIHTEVPIFFKMKAR